MSPLGLIKRFINKGPIEPKVSKEYTKYSLTHSCHSKIISISSYKIIKYYSLYDTKKWHVNVNI